MPPKASKPKSSSEHASYQAMISEAILNLKERNGSSRVALKKYVKANNKITVSDNQFDSLFNKAIRTGVEKGVFAQPKGSSGGTKLAKKEPKPAAPKPVKKVEKKEKKPAVKKTTTAKKPAVKKATTTKKPAAPKKEKIEKKPAVKKVVKKPAAKPKDAPAVVDKPTVLSKTKSGRVTKTAAKPKTPAKKAAAKPKTSAKKATPKKA